MVKIENISAINNLVAAIRQHDEYLLSKITTCFPASVVKYDRERHEVEVLPLVKESYYDGEWKYRSRTPIRVKLRSIQQGGFTLDIPLYVGDTGWVITSDRDTTLLKQDGALTNVVLEGDRNEEGMIDRYPQAPNSQVMHDPSMGFFIPDNWGRFEFGRWKDGGNVNVGSSLYIGSSIDTKDESIKDEESRKQQKTNQQSGDIYENSDSSSFIVERHGGIHLSSSSKEEDRKQSHVSVIGGTIEKEVIDEKNGTLINASFSSDNGISLRQISSMNGIVSMSVNDDMTSIITEGISIYVKDGIITIDTKAPVNLNTKGDVSVESESDVDITAAEVSIITEGKTKVNSNGNIDICSTEINIHSNENMKIESPNGIIFKPAEKTSGITVKSGEKLTIKSTDISFDGYSGKSFITEGSEGGTIKFKTPKITMSSKEKEGDTDSSVDISQDKVSMEAHGKTSGGISIYGEDISIEGEVNISGKEVSITNYNRGYYQKTSESKSENALTYGR